MKSILKKTLAVLLVFSFVFAFAACGKDKEKETTTAVETTVEATADQTTMEATTEDATTGPAEETTTEAPGETTTETAALTLPIGGNAAQVLEFYNQYGNAIKNYKGKVTVTKTDGTVSQVNYIAMAAITKKLAQDMLPNDYKAKPTYTFVNGTSTVDGKTLSKWLPRDKSAKLSELSPTGANGVKSATCTASGSGCKIVILMNDDIVTGESAINAPAKYVSKCMDTLDMQPGDLEPFILKKASVNYTGCSIEAVFDDQGRLTKLDILTPANIKGDLAFKSLDLLKDTDITGNYKGNYTFTY